MRLNHAIMTLPPAGDWPPRGSYREAAGGWFLNSDSSDWLYKPSSDVYFHSPTESLWRRARGQNHFVRVDQPSSGDGSANCSREESSHYGYELALVALSFGAANGATLLRVCFTSWNVLRSKNRKFEEMQRDLLDCCEAARSEAGMMPKLRISPPQAGRRASFGEMSDEGLWPGFARLLGLPKFWTASEEWGNDENAEPCNCASPAIGNNAAPLADTLESTDLSSPKPSPLTSMAMARHNVDPLQDRRTSPGLNRGRSKELGAALHPAFSRSRSLGELRQPLRHNLLAAVHLEREAGWRHHVRWRPSLIEDLENISARWMHANDVDTA